MSVPVHLIRDDGTARTSSQHVTPVMVGEWMAENRALLTARRHCDRAVNEAIAEVAKAISLSAHPDAAAADIGMADLIVARPGGFGEIAKTVAANRRRTHSGV